MILTRFTNFIDNPDNYLGGIKLIIEKVRKYKGTQTVVFKCFI